METDDGADIVLLIEALDALLPFPEDAGRLWSTLSKEELDRWAPFAELRSRLKQAVHMSFYDWADKWLERELRHEREALSDRLFSILVDLMRQPSATRRTVREGFGAAVRELRESRQSTLRPLS